MSELPEPKEPYRSPSDRRALVIRIGSADSTHGRQDDPWNCPVAWAARRAARVRRTVWLGHVPEAFVSRDFVNLYDLARGYHEQYQIPEGLARQIIAYDTKHGGVPEGRWQLPFVQRWYER